MARASHHLRPARVALLAAVAVCAVSSLARADGGVTLRWSAPDTCPAAVALRADLEQLAGRALAWDGPEPLVVDAQVTREEEARWTLRLALTPRGRPTSVRNIEGRTCEELARATVSIVALTLEPLASEPPPPPAAPPAPPPPRPLPKAERATPLAAPRDEAGVALGPLLSFGIDVAALPSVAAAVGIGAFVSHDDDRLELRGLALLPRDGALDAASGGTFSLFAGALRYCRRLVGEGVGEDIELGACGGFEGGALNGEGYGFDRNVAQTGLWLAPSLGGRVLLPFGRKVAASLDVEGLAPLVRDRYRLAGADVVHRPAPLDARFLLALGFIAFH